jgi:serine/threonine-protein kinase RsbW
LNSEAYHDASSSQVVKEVQLQIQATFKELRTIDKPIDSLLENVDSFDESAVYNVKLAVHEICTNIVEHAYEFERDAQIGLWLGLIEKPAVRLVVKLRDSGLPFDNVPDGYEEPSSDLDNHGDGGYGLFLAHMLMDSVEYRRVGEYNLWRMEIQPSPLGNDRLLQEGSLTDEHSR